MLIKRAHPSLSTLGCLLCLLTLAPPPAEARPYRGPKPITGSGASFHQYWPAADTSLQLTYRDGDYGVVGTGLVSELGYRFGRRAVVTSLGAELWLGFVGLRIDAALEADLDDHIYAPGVAYRVAFGLGPILYLNLGGQSLFGRGTEFVTGVGVTMFDYD